MQIITLPQGRRMHRDPLTAHIRDTYDPTSPEAIASANRAREAQREMRAKFLTDLWEKGDEDGFDYNFRLYFREDPLIVWALNSRVHAAAAVRMHKGRVS